MSNARIRIKIGHIEVEYEGENSFLQSDFLQLVNQVVDLQKTIPNAAIMPTLQNATGGNVVNGPTTDLSTDTIATLMKVSTAPELIMAAAAKLTFSEGKQKFTRQEIVTAMREAPGYFKDSYMGNLSKSLKSLTTSDKLRLVATDTYSISNAEKQSLGASLANA